MQSENRKKYVTCDWLEHGIVFDYENIIRHCSYFNPEYDGRPIIYEGYEGKPFDWESFWEIKRKCRENAVNGILPKECTSCDWLKETEYDDSDYLNNILLTPWAKCNCKCIYCGVTCNDEQDKLESTYPVYPVMKDFIEKNVFTKDTVVDMAGGEPTLYKDFDKLLGLFVNNGFTNIVVHTNTFKYSKMIEKGISKGIVKILVSIDAGTKEVHKKVKQVDCFEKVWKHVKKYLSKQPKGKTLVRVKYIIVPDKNDDKEELNLWLLKAKSLGINSVALNIDHNWISKNINNVPEKLIDVIDYTLDRAKELEMDCQWYPGVTEIQKRRQNQ